MNSKNLSTNEEPYVTNNSFPNEEIDLEDSMELQIEPPTKSGTNLGSLTSDELLCETSIPFLHKKECSPTNTMGSIEPSTKSETNFEFDKRDDLTSILFQGEPLPMSTNKFNNYNLYGKNDNDGTNNLDNNKQEENLEEDDIESFGVTIVNPDSFSPEEKEFLNSYSDLYIPEYKPKNYENDFIPGNRHFSSNKFGSKSCGNDFTPNNPLFSSHGFGSRHHGNKSVFGDRLPSPKSKLFDEKTKKMEMISKNFPRLKSICEKPKLEDVSLIKDLIRHNSEIGIIRNIKYLVPIYVGEKENEEFLNDCMCIAIENAHLDIAKYFLNNGCNPAYKNEKPLQVAIKSGHIESIQLLVNCGANLNFNNGTFLVDCCKAGDYPEIIKFLINQKINIYDNYGEAIKVCWNLKRTKSEEILIKNHNVNENIDDDFSSSKNSIDDELEKYMNRYNTSDSEEEEEEYELLEE